MRRRRGRWTRVSHVWPGAAAPPCSAQVASPARVHVSCATQASVSARVPCLCPLRLARVQGAPSGRAATAQRLPPALAAGVAVEEVVTVVAGAAAGVAAGVVAGVAAEAG